MFISDDRDIHTCCPMFSSGAVTTCFYDLGLLWLEFEHPTSHMQGERSDFSTAAPDHIPVLQGVYYH